MKKNRTFKEEIRRGLSYTFLDIVVLSIGLMLIMVLIYNSFLAFLSVLMLTLVSLFAHLKEREEEK